MAPRSTLSGNAHLPPHLREVCGILARGLVRLRSRAAEDDARDAAQGRGAGDIRLHSTAEQRLHAKPNRKGLA
jgi:hypothetical protein